MVNEKRTRITRITRTILYLIVSMFFITIPTIIKIFGAIIGQNRSVICTDLIKDFYDGSLYLYAISLLSPIWYIIDAAFTDNKGKRKDKHAPVTPTLVVMIAVLILYVITYFLDMTDIKVKPVPSAIISILALVVSLTLAYLIKYHEDENISEPDSVRKASEDLLEQRMDDVESGKAVDVKKKGVKGKLSFVDFEEEES